jgi:hypothetical protein
MNHHALFLPLQQYVAGQTPLFVGEHRLTGAISPNGYGAVAGSRSMPSQLDGVGTNRRIGGVLR